MRRILLSLALLLLAAPAFAQTPSSPAQPAATAQAGARFYHHMMIVLGTPGVVVAGLLAVPVVNLVAPIVGAAFMTLRFQRRDNPSTHVLRE